MAVHNNGGVFVVKDRLEALEARIETALDEAGLKDFTKQVARDAIGDIVNDIVGERANTCVVVGGNNKNFVNTTGIGHGVNGAKVVYCQVAVAVESGVEVWHYAKGPLAFAVVLL